MTEIRTPLLPVLTLYTGFDVNDRVSRSLVPVTTAEKNAIRWPSATVVYTLMGKDMCCCIFRPHMALSARFPSIDRVFMVRNSDDQIRLLQARIQRVLYDKSINRRTALMMAFHPGLGSESAFGKLPVELIPRLV
jgi:hypothetical protein